jgi:hypothetical protein
MAGAGQHAQDAQQQQQQQHEDISQQISKGAQEAGEALVKEFAKDITATEPAGDPEVIVAFALGWQISELYKPGSWREQNAKPEKDLPGLGHLGGKERAQLGLKQIEVGLKKLEQTIKNAGPNMPSVIAATEAIPATIPNPPYEKAIFELHVSLLTTLTATHFKLGKAYGLGRALADTTRVPTDLDTLKTELKGPRVTNLTNWLSDLTSLFPPHAGHIVHGRVEAWRDWVTKATPQSDPDGKAVSLLRREGQRWRSLLSGEKSATDALKLEDYVDAGELALSHTSTLALGFLGRFKLAATAAGILFVGGLLLVIFEPTSGSLAGGLAGILASLGLTWKGVGASLGGAAAKVERPVWEGALDTQIANSISLLPGSEPAGRYVPPDPPPGPAAP